MGTEVALPGRIADVMEAMYFGDRLENVVANLATGKAKTASDRFSAPEIDAAELTAMYRGDWMARKIVDIPVGDALRTWRSWNADERIIEIMEDQERRFDVRRKVARSLRWARLYGGAAILIHTGDPNPAMPLRSIRRNGLRNLVVLHRRELAVQGLQDDPREAGFREPTGYMLATSNGAGVMVHPSRIIRIVGPERPDFEANSEGWGDSVLQVAYEAVHHAALTNGGIAELVHEAKIDVVNVKGLSSAASSKSGEAAITKRFALASMMKAINNTLLLDEGETWNRKQTSFSALPDVVKTFLQIVSGAADIPLTRFLGSSPGGLNSTGESDLRNYYDSLSSYRADTIRPVIERIDDVLAADAGGTLSANEWWDFGPLWEPSPKEKAEIADKKASTTQKYVNMGLFPQEALLDVVSNQLVEDGTYPGLEQSLAKIRSAIASDIEQNQAEIAALEADRPARGFVP